MFCTVGGRFVPGEKSLRHREHKVHTQARGRGTELTTFLLCTAVLPCALFLFHMYIIISYNEVNSNCERHPCCTVLSTHLSLAWDVVFFVQHRHFLSLSEDCCLGSNSLLLEPWLISWSGTSSHSHIRGVDMLPGDIRAAHEWKALFSVMFAFMCRTRSVPQCFVAIAQNVTTNPRPIVATLLLSLFYKPGYCSHSMPLSCLRKKDRQIEKVVNRKLTQRILHPVMKSDTQVNITSCSVICFCLFFKTDIHIVTQLQDTGFPLKY